jgi:membrane protein YqaA with SNARE-associated domain
MFEILGGLLLATAISGIIPLINAEILVVAAAASTPTVGVPLIAAASTVGQMSTKTMLFIVARWAPSRLPRKAQRALAKVSKAVEARGGAAGSLVFMSAAVGLPPFYGVSLASGALGMRLRAFVVSGTAGRAVRFTVLAWAGRRFGEDALQLISAQLSSVPFLGA